MRSIDEVTEPTHETTETKKESAEEPKEEPKTQQQDSRHGAMELMKEEGNNFFKEGKYEDALKSYEKCLRSIGMLFKEEKDVAKSYRIILKLNMAAVYLKMKSYNDTISMCNEVLELDPKNMKALYRRAMAYLELQRWDESEKDFKKMIEIDKNNKIAPKQLKHIYELRKKYYEKEKKKYRGWLQNANLYSDKADVKISMWKKHPYIFASILILLCILIIFGIYKFV